MIKERNKPIQPPTAPTLAPFFLPTTADSTEQSRPSFVATLAEDAASQPQKKSRILSGTTLKQKSKLRLLLDDAAARNDCTRSLLSSFAVHAPNLLVSDAQVVEHFAAMSPSAIDLELRMLDIGDDYAEYRLLMKFFSETLRTRNNMELVQALLNVFLKVRPLRTRCVAVVDVVYFFLLGSRGYHRHEQVAGASAGGGARRGEGRMGAPAGDVPPLALLALLDLRHPDLSQVVPHPLLPLPLTSPQVLRGTQFCVCCIGKSTHTANVQHTAASITMEIYGTPKGRRRARITRYARQARQE